MTDGNPQVQFRIHKGRFNLVSCIDKYIKLISILIVSSQLRLGLPEGLFLIVRINLPLFSTFVPAIIFMFLSCRPFVAITTLSTGVVGVEVTSVSWLGQLTVGV